MCDLMLSFFQLVDPLVFKIKEEDWNSVRVWRAEASFLLSFEDLFDVKLLNKDDLSNATIKRKMAENIDFY